MVANFKLFGKVKIQEGCQNVIIISLVQKLVIKS